MESFARKQYCPELARMLGLIDFACQKRASLKKKSTSFKNEYSYERSLKVNR